MAGAGCIVSWTSVTASPDAAGEYANRADGTWTDNLVRVAGHRWLQVAQDRKSWKSKRETYVQWWTLIG
ncbi:hypothetical protein EVAR_2614_1 [Eumeta japonica]|uniref:Uncharacterized protein n=1 Tax=Eumeta variegata TaxID=151549 RepID=A0A4C1SM02_EUMVA|nr:hypothetical protein EVAR_2614_1 [Eumeta japonica]